MTDILVPDNLWDDGSPGVISTWFFEAGDMVAEGTVVGEVMNEKISFEIFAPTAGKLVIDFPAETEVALGQIIGRIEAP